MNLEFLKRRWYYLAPAVLLLVPMVMVLFYSAKFGYSVSESWTAVRHFSSSATRYGQKFSERQFSRIKPGLDGRQVFELVGVPLEGQDRLDWHYSFPQSGAQAYHERVVLFERNPKTSIPFVKSVIKRFHSPDTK